MLGRFLRAVFNFFYEILLGCSHDRLTRPFTLQQETYKVCLDCGKQVFYSPVDMRPLSARETRRMRATQAGEVRVFSGDSGSAAMARSQREESKAAA